MAFNKDPHDPTGNAAGQSGDPAPDARNQRAARLTRLQHIDEQLGAAMTDMAKGEALIRRTLAHRCDIADHTRRLYLERNTLISANTSGKWTPQITAERETAMEIAVTLGIPELTARDLLARAVTLVHELPTTHTALSRGQISFRHAEVIATESWTLPPEGRAAFDTAVVPAAIDTTVTQFTKRMRIIRERLHPISLTARHQHALKDRAVWVDTSPDGMATLTYIDSAEKVIPIYHRIDATARALQGPTEERTLGQLRADTLGDLGLNGTPSTDYDTGAVPTVLIAVPALTAMGEGMEPGMMDGYGPIDPDTARRLSARAPSFYRILTDPETGTILNVGRTAYKPPADLRRYLQLRDGTCRGGVGCPTPADRCDLDHTIDWQYGGETSAENLSHLCKNHHNFKGNTSWTVTQIGGGRLQWTSPSGQTHITEPNSFIGPMPFVMPTTAAEPTAANEPDDNSAPLSMEPGGDRAPEVVDPPTGFEVGEHSEPPVSTRPGEDPGGWPYQADPPSTSDQSNPPGTSEQSASPSASDPPDPPGRE